MIYFLISVLGLPLDYCEQIDPFVRGKFKKIWQSAHDND
jgi:hypothetical protein